MDRKAILEIILFNNILNNFSFINNIKIVRMLYFCINVVSTKHWIEPKLTRTQKVRF